MTLGDRMKQYEASYEQHMISRLPVIIRVDGKGFSKWTKKVGAYKPFDENLMTAMSTTMCDTADRIEGCVFGYTQSDEMTFVLRNDQSLESTPWFGNRVQKICSIVASIVTANFAKFYPQAAPAYFDARVFLVPSLAEAHNALVWRQNDAVKNSISAACYYEVARVVGKKTARKMMHGLNQKQQQELLFQEAKINWNNYATKVKRGLGCYHTQYKTNINGNSCIRSSWVIEDELPIFAQDKEYLQGIIGDYCE